MIFIKLLFLLVLSTNSQQIYDCDFDYDQKCLPGLLSAPFILLNETSEEPRQPVSDVTAIETSNDGECFFPFPFGSFQMYFCEKTDPTLPATCPTFNATGPRINCSEGEYGYEKFEEEETGIRSYKLDLTSDLSSGEHCLRFYYYLSDENSNGSVKVIVEDSESNINVTIATASSRSENKWYQMRENFLLSNDNPTIYFVFERGSSSDSYPFYIAIDEITIIDIQCEPISTTTTTESSTTTQTTESINTTTTPSILLNTTITSQSSSSSSSSTITSTSTTSTTTQSTSRTTISTTSQSTSSTTISTTSQTTSRTSSTTNSVTSTSTSTLTTTVGSSSTTIYSTLTSTTTTDKPSSSIKNRSNILLIILFVIFLKE